jgi:hypothetical protein
MTGETRLRSLEYINVGSAAKNNAYVASSNRMTDTAPKIMPCEIRDRVGAITGSCVDEQPMCGELFVQTAPMDSVGLDL